MVFSETPPCCEGVINCVNCTGVSWSTLHIPRWGNVDGVSSIGWLISSSTTETQGASTSSSPRHISSFIVIR